MLLLRSTLKTKHIKKRKQNRKFGNNGKIYLANNHKEAVVTTVLADRIELMGKSLIGK